MMTFVYVCALRHVVEVGQQGPVRLSRSVRTEYTGSSIATYPSQDPSTSLYLQASFKVLGTFLT